MILRLYRWASFHPKIWPLVHFIMQAEFKIKDMTKTKHESKRKIQSGVCYDCGKPSIMLIDNKWPWCGVCYVG